MGSLSHDLRALGETARLAFRHVREPGTLFRLGWRFYPYFRHPYNAAHANERAVEVPLAMQFLNEGAPAAGLEILEVGNVLSHYFNFRHDIVDKYEQAAGVLNCDVIDFAPGKLYDRIVSISTLEHVGWDEPVKDPRKILTALAHLKDLLKPNGRLFVTLPLGYNPDMDRLIRQGELRFPKQHYLLRLDAANRWREARWAQVDGARYGAPFDFANALVLGIDGRG